MITLFYPKGKTAPEFYINSNQALDEAFVPYIKLTGCKHLFTDEVNFFKVFSL